MKGLILKDFYNLSTVWKTLLALAVFYIIYGIFMDSSFMISMMVMIFALQVVSAFTYDKLSGFDAYAATLCVSRRQVVGARYLTALLLLGVSAVAAAAGGLVLYGIGKLSGDLSAMLISILSVAALGLFFNAAILPLVYKFGVEKSRLMMFAIFSLPVVGLMLFIRSGIELSEQAATAAVIAFPFIAIAAFALSYMISLRIYATREL